MSTFPRALRGPLRPKAWVQDPFNQQQLSVCRRCCKGVGSAGFQLSRCNGKAQPADNVDAFTLPQVVEVVDAPVGCINECGAVYCSEECRRIDWEETHEKLCVGPLREDDPFVAFIHLALQSEFYAELMLASRLAAGATIEDLEKWQGLGLGCGLLEMGSNKLDEVFQEAWPFVKETALMWEGSWTRESWLGLCVYVLAQRIELEVVSLPQMYMKGLYCATEDVQEEARCAVLGLLSDDADFDEDLTSSQRFRKVMADPGSYYPSVYVSAIFEELDEVAHSCAPSLRIEVAKDTALQGLSIHVSKVNDSSISGETNLSIARVGVDGGVDEREELLRQSLGLTGPCSCIRCTCCCCEEKNVNVLKLLAHDAMENERYDDALGYLEAALRLDPTDGKLLYERARVTSWSDRWSEAHQLILEAHVLAPDNEQISAEMNSYNAYTSAFAGKICAKTDIKRSDLELYDGKVRVYEGLLDRDECSGVIAQVEAQVSSQGGWTTSRHYAVPTTDIPVHTVPAALCWFNKCMHLHVFPLLADQFDVVAERIRVIDAFVVKYTSEKQRALPLHCDQSQFSLTIAMNPREEYEGGGTFFEETGVVTNCDQGGVISFDGALLHGGYPVSKGTRYVVVAFLYEQVEGDA